MSIDTLGDQLKENKNASAMSKASNWTDEDYVEFALEFLSNADKMRTKAQRGWDEAWEIYNNSFDFSEKADWQSQNYLPKFKMSVRSSKYILHQSLIKGGEYQRAIGLTDEAKEYVKDIENGCQKALTQVGFTRQFARAVFLGLLENLMIFKCRVEPLGPNDPKIHPSQRYKFPLEPVSAYDFWPDPKGRFLGCLHRTKMDLADYRQAVKDGMFLASSLDLVVEDFESKEDEYQRLLREGATDIGKPDWRKEVELLEYWGHIDDELGNRVHSNATFTIVNRKYLASRPKKNEFNHGTPPFVYGPIIEKFPSVYHEGFGDGVIAIAKMINESLNLILDANLAASVKAFEVNLDMVANPSELKSGIYPNKVIRSRGGAPGQNAVRDFSLGNINPESMQILQMLGGEFDNGTGSNEFISTAAQSMGGGTATEAKLKSSSAMSFMQAMAGEIQENVLEPAVKMTADNIFQYNPEIFGEDILALPKDKARFSFEVRGMTKILSQIEEMNKLFMWVKFFMGTPIAKQINWEEIAKSTARLVGEDDKRLLLPEQKQDPQPGAGLTATDNANEQMANAQMIAMQGGKG